MAHRDRLVASGTGFQQAALVLGTKLLIAVLVGEVDFHPCDLRGETVQGIPHDRFNLLREPLITLDVAISVDLDLHSSNLL
jgi:hypothetical protein